ncbi:ABC transporter permease [Prolixibacteraceae bacterium Z1-6]|uniref:ABC transporter permease n=1 Tax=Draconibacterium aestuarii TaxID=2998507 RepID=A0A9X3F2D0_9BACT|nr:ABC transporter permease [Prolixibacteraceae bacterium Z1-6]
MNNILKPIIRNFLRKPVISLINLFGLATSLVFVIILSVYCYNELTTDTHHAKAERIYLIGKPGAGMNTPAVLKPHIDMEVPGVEAAIRVAGTWQAPVFQAEDGQPITSDLIFSDSEFFSFFNYKTLEGDCATALINPLSVVITKPLANKLFGRNSAVGKTIKYNNEKLLTVSAVIEKPAGNSFLDFSAVTSIETRKILQPSEGEFKEWGWSNFQTFLLLGENADPAQLAQTIFLVFPEKFQKWIEEIHLIKLKDVYFSNLQTFGAHHVRMGDKYKALILLFVAGLILTIALVNFINISSSQWMEKIKQTGVLKVIGATRIIIFCNVLSETFLLFISAVILAVIIMAGVTPIIQNYTGIQFSTKLISRPILFLVLFASTLVFSLVLSLIPGLRISSSKAVNNLRKSIDQNSKKSYLRNGLITLQYVIAIVLIAFTTLIYKQVEFGSNNLVFNQENTIAVKLTPQLKKDIIKQEFEKIPGVQNVSLSQFYPGKQLSSWGTKLNLNGEEQEVHFTTFSADAEFFSLMDLELVMGKFYSDGSGNDKDKVIVNEKFLKEFNLENPIGGTFEMQKGTDFEIIGVVRDFNFKTVEKPIEPLAIINQGYASYCLTSIQSGDFKSLSSTLKHIQAVTSKLSPSFPVEVSFLDSAVINMYESEVRFRRTFSLFSISAIIICAMGILAMSIFATQRRVKEIGIRKVNGAKVAEVLALLNKDFVRWVVIAFVIATPIAYYAMSKWLENFAYKTNLSWWIFALAGVLALGIALLTVSWQSWRAATRNPVEALRYE